MEPFLINQTKNSYLKVSGLSIKSIYTFLCRYGVWNQNDSVYAAFEPVGMHDITYVINFYNKDRESELKIKEMYELHLEQNAQIEELSLMLDSFRPFN